MNRETWSKKEKGVAKRAFEKAYEKECREIIRKIREVANKAGNPDDIWRLHDFLTKKRRETDDKYDYRYSVLILVFARLIKEGWINADDLEGLSEDKVEKILHFANMRGIRVRA